MWKSLQMFTRIEKKKQTQKSHIHTQTGTEEMRDVCMAMECLLAATQMVKRALDERR